MPNIQILSLYIIGFVTLHAVWLLTDFHSQEERLHSLLHADFTGVYLIQVTLIGLELLQAAIVPLPPTRADPYLEAGGVVLFTAGIILAVWAKLTMGSAWGHPGTFNPDRQRSVVTTGPFALSRNPIYTGILLFVLGFSLGMRSFLLPANLLLFVYIDRMIRKEEALLEDHFGDTYMRYKRRVRRYL